MKAGNFSNKILPHVPCGDYYEINGWPLDIDAVVAEAHANHLNGQFYIPAPDGRGGPVHEA